MWKNTWGVKEGIMTCGGLIAIGLILHLFTGAVDWSSFAWPLNICILTVYVVALIMLYILRKKLYFVRWTMSYNAAVPSLIAVVFLTIIDSSCISDIPYGDDKTGAIFCFFGRIFHI